MINTYYSVGLHVVHLQRTDTICASWSSHICMKYKI